MDKGILSEVIEVEKEIQKHIESEKVKTREWLETVKKGSEEALTREEEKISESFHKAVEDAIHDAEGKASDIVQDAAAQSGRLEKLDDGTLTRIIMKQINRVLPG